MIHPDIQEILKKLHANEGGSPADESIWDSDLTEAQKLAAADAFLNDEHERVVAESREIVRLLKLL